MNNDNLRKSHSQILFVEFQTLLEEIVFDDQENKPTLKNELQFDEVREVLDIFDGDFPPKISDQHFNSQIKKVAKIAKLNKPEIGELVNSETKRKEKGEYPKWKLVSSHIMRRSLATNYYAQYPTSLLIKITKHSTKKQFLNYIHKDAIEHIKHFEYEIDRLKKDNEKDKTKVLSIITG